MYLYVFTEMNGDTFNSTCNKEVHAALGMIPAITHDRLGGKTRLTVCTRRTALCLLWKRNNITKILK